MYLPPFAYVIPDAIVTPGYPTVSHAANVTANVRTDAYVTQMVDVNVIRTIQTQDAAVFTGATVTVNLDACATVLEIAGHIQNGVIVTLLVAIALLTVRQRHHVVLMLALVLHVSVIPGHQHYVHVICAVSATPGVRVMPGHLYETQSSYYQPV